MKRWLLVCCLLLIVGTSKAQSTLEAIQQTIDLFDKQDYENAIKVAEKALPKVKLEFGESSPFYSGMILFIGLSHFRLFHYAKAEPFFIQQLQLTAKNAGEKSMDYIASLNNLALLYREMGRYSDTEELYAEALRITQSLFGSNDTVYAKSLNNQASMFQFTGQYTKAEQIFIQSGNIIKSVAGENTTLYATSLNNLATLYSDMGQYQKSKPLMIRATTIRKALLGSSHPDYAGSLNNLAYTLSALGEYKEAEQNFIEARDIYKRTLGDNHPDYASTINNLAELYRSIGEYEKAENLYKESLNIRKRTVGESHPDYALSLNNLGSFYDFTGQFEQAEKLFKEARDIIKKALGEEHPYYLTTLNNLAGLYHSNGQYVLAEPLYIRSKDIRKKIYGDSHPGYAMSLNNLATIYQEMGLYKKAEPLYLKAKDIWKQALGDRHPDYAMCLNNLAALYEDMEEYAKAEPLYIQARDTRKMIFGENHTDYATSLNNLAGLYVKMGQYKKAEATLLPAREIWKKVLGENHPLYATCLNNIAALYRKAQINPAQSEQLYLQALELRKRILGPSHPLTTDTENDLALLYMNRGLPAKAAPLFIKSSQDVMQTLKNTFPVLSEREKAGFIGTNILFDACNNSFLYQYRNAGTAVINNNLNLQLFFKSISLADTRNMLAAVRNTRDTVLKRLYMNWQNLRVLLAKQYSLPASQRMKNLSQKEEEAETIEKDLGRRSASFREQQQAMTVSMTDIQRHLDPDEAAIEFVSFRYFNKKETDSIIYAAYIYKAKDSAAVYVPLFEERQFQKLLDSAGKSPSRVAHQFYRGIEIKDRSDISLENSIYNLVWKPLEENLKGVKKIAYSPAGKLYGIAFHALKVDSNTMLMDKYQLQQYVSTRQIAFRSTATSAKPNSIALFGDADFSMDSLQIASEKGNESPGIGADVVTRGGGGPGWPGLPGTAEEVAAISHLFDLNKINTRSFLKTAATERNLKTLSGHSPSVLHIATHGFYIPEGKTSSGNVYRVAQDPLLRNGLVLAGGNYVWGGKEPIEGVEDGIITAYEIAQMDLSETQLIVLSACETALGDIKGAEGVFGLQRGFKLAGVDKMILSLWQVPDKETAELMSSFYSQWLKGNTIEKAFQTAQTEMRRKYAPFYWAAFVLIQ